MVGFNAMFSFATRVAISSISNAVTLLAPNSLEAILKTPDPVPTSKTLSFPRIVCSKAVRDN